MWDTSQGMAHERANKIAVLKFVLKKFAKWGGGGTPHVVQTAHANGEGVASSTCMYIYSYMNMYI